MKTAAPHFQGKLTLTPQTKAIHSTLCAHVVRYVTGGPIYCEAPTANGEQWCYAHKDPGGYTERLRQARAEATQRCLEAYPTCRRCGGSLPPALVAQGETRHSGGRKEDCYYTAEDVP